MYNPYVDAVGSDLTGMPDPTTLPHQGFEFDPSIADSLNAALGIYPDPPAPELQVAPSIDSDLAGAAGLLPVPEQPIAAPTPEVPAPTEMAPIDPYDANAPDTGEMYFPPDDFSGDQVLSLAPDAPPAEETFAPDDFSDNPALEDEVARQDQLRISDPVAAAGEDARRAQARREAVEAEETRLRTEDIRAAEQNLKMTEQAVAKANADSAALVAEAQALADQGIDNERWWTSRSTGQKMAAAFAAAIGGWLAPSQGGRNRGMEAIQKYIDDDIETQGKNIQNKMQVLGMRQGIVAQEYARTGDLYRAKETARLAAYKHWESQLASAAAQVDPMGTQAQAITQMQQQARDEIAKKEAALKQQTLENELAVGRFNLEQKRFELQRRAARAAEAARRDAAAERERQRNAPPTPEQILKHRKLAAETEKAEADAKVAKSGAVGGPSNDPNAIGDASGNAYRNKDGSVFTIKDDTRRYRINEINVAAHNLRRIADLVDILKDKEGGASSVVGSPEYQELVSLAAQVDFETYKAFGLGAPSAGDREMAENARGGKDITSFIYDSSSGFKTYADGVESKLNSEMRSSGYSGPKVRIPRMDRARSLELSKEENAERIQQGVPPHVQDPEARREYVSRAKTAVDVNMRRKDPTSKELRSWAQGVQKQVEDGTLTRSEAEEIVYPMAMRLVREQEADNRKNKPNAISERMNDSVDLLSGSAAMSPSEAYDFVLGVK